jgi:hypothetical protein
MITTYPSGIYPTIDTMVNVGLEAAWVSNEIFDYRSRVETELFARGQTIAGRFIEDQLHNPEFEAIETESLAVVWNKVNSEFNRAMNIGGAILRPISHIDEAHVRHIFKDGSAS